MNRLSFLVVKIFGIVISQCQKRLTGHMTIMIGMTLGTARTSAALLPPKTILAYSGENMINSGKFIVDT